MLVLWAKGLNAKGIHKLMFHVCGGKCLLKGWDGVDWIDMAQDRDQWRALVNTVLNLRVP
jgi:hypothetical protein